jgi:beta-glucanase (GH16 family)
MKYTAAAIMAATAQAGKKLVLDENFDTLNHDLWKNEVFSGENMVNGEFEAYTNSADNTFIKDGVLFLQPIITGDPNVPITSSRVKTQGSFSVLYGRVEVRAKLPRGDWLWPAIWMLPRDSVYG